MLSLIKCRYLNSEILVQDKNDLIRSFQQPLTILTASFEIFFYKNNISENIQEKS